MMGSLPNYNEAVIDYRGRLFPFNWARLLWRLATDRFRSGRVVVFGVRKSIHGTPMAAPVTTALIEAMLEEMQRKYEWFEISWVLDINVPMMRLCERICGAPAKRYRIYGGAL
jgi:hypothetical protein